MRSPKYFEKKIKLVKEKYDYYTKNGWIKELALLFALKDLEEIINESIDTKVTVLNSDESL